MTNKDKYGEVFTPLCLVERMLLDGFGDQSRPYCGESLRIFEPGAGKGIFYKTIMENYDAYFGAKPCQYILNEINPEHEETLKEVLLDEGVEGVGNICIQNVFDVVLDTKVDLIVGNLPFHNGGKAFVPGLAKFHGDDGDVTKPKDIVTIWPKIIHHCFDSFLKPRGIFFCIIPCIWMKEDRAGIYDLFVRKNELLLLRVFDCVRANALFGYNCQTPVCYVMVRKRSDDGFDGGCSTLSSVHHFQLYDEDVGKYIDFPLKIGRCIPTKHASLCLECLQGGEGANMCSDVVKKVSTLKKGVMDNVVYTFHKQNKDTLGLLCDYACKEGEYKVITGAAMDGKWGCGSRGGEDDGWRKCGLILHGVVSKVEGIYGGKPKLILPHKRLPLFFKDYDGSYSCYGRDMYVFLCDGGKAQIDALETYLSSKKVSTIIAEGFTIRMNFIEKYVFQYIPYLGS